MDMFYIVENTNFHHEKKLMSDYLIMEYLFGSSGDTWLVKISEEFWRKFWTTAR